MRFYYLSELESAINLWHQIAASHVLEDEALGFTPQDGICHKLIQGVTTDGQCFLECREAWKWSKFSA